MSEFADVSNPRARHQELPEPIRYAFLLEDAFEFSCISIHYRAPIVGCNALICHPGHAEYFPIVVV